MKRCFVNVKILSETSQKNGGITLREILERALGKGREEVIYGETASYIPELGRVDKNQLGVCIYTSDGKKEAVGDYDVRFRAFPR